MSAATNTGRDRLHELLADRATQGLSPVERDELEALGGLDETSYDWTAAAIDLPTLLAEEEVMPASARDRVDVAAVAWLAQAKGLAIVTEQEQAPPDARGAVVTGPPAAGLGAGWMPWLAAAAAIALAVAAWWPTRAMDTADLRVALMQRDDTTVLPWNDAAGLGVSGDVVWNNAANEGYLRFTGLAVNDPSRVQYQLWIFDDARKAYSDAIAVDGGVFDVDRETGDVIVPIDAKLGVSRPSLFAVTTEPPGGVVKHRTDEAKGYRIILTASEG